MVNKDSKCKATWLQAWSRSNGKRKLIHVAGQSIVVNTFRASAQHSHFEEVEMLSSDSLSNHRFLFLFPVTGVLFIFAITLNTYNLPLETMGVHPNRCLGPRCYQSYLANSEFGGSAVKSCLHRRLSKYRLVVNRTDWCCGDRGTKIFVIKNDRLHVASFFAIKPDLSSWRANGHSMWPGRI